MSVYFIAEAGVNHGGDFDTAMRLIDAAKQVGADSVKFQLFNANLLRRPEIKHLEHVTPVLFLAHEEQPLVVLGFPAGLDHVAGRRRGRARWPRP